MGKLVKYIAIGVAGFIFIIFFAGVIAGLFGVKHKDANTIQEQVSPIEPEKKPKQENEQEVQKEIKHGVEVINYKGEVGEYGNKFIVGTVKNYDNRQYTYVQIEFNLYDQNRVQVGSTIANVSNLEPYGTWRFKTIVDDATVLVKLKGISKF